MVYLVARRLIRRSHSPRQLSLISLHRPNRRRPNLHRKNNSPSSSHRHTSQASTPTNPNSIAEPSRDQRPRPPQFWASVEMLPEVWCFLLSMMKTTCLPSPPPEGRTSSQGPTPAYPPHRNAVPSSPSDDSSPPIFYSSGSVVNEGIANEVSRPPGSLTPATRTCPRRTSHTTNGRSLLLERLDGAACEGSSGLIEGSGRVGGRERKGEATQGLSRGSRRVRTRNDVGS